MVESSFLIAQAGIYILDVAGPCHHTVHESSQSHQLRRGKWIVGWLQNLFLLLSCSCVLPSLVERCTAELMTIMLLHCANAHGYSPKLTKLLC